MIDIIAYLFLFLGSLLLLVSAIGVLRLPDAITQIHAGTKASTLGTLLIIIGTICLEPTLWFKLIILGLFILLTNPLSSSTLAKSAYKKDGFYTQSNTNEMDETK